MVTITTAGEKSGGAAPTRLLSQEVTISIFTIAAVLVVWWLVTSVFNVSPLILPSPRAMGQELATLLSAGYAGKPLYAHIAASLFRSMSGLVAGICLAIPVGLLMGYSSAVNAALVPIFGFFRPIPPIAFIPLMILWFGIGELSKVLLIFAASFNYTVLNSAAGMRAVPEQLIRKGRNLGLTPRQLFLSVMLPAAMPHIFTGIKTSTAVSWAIVVAAELIAAQEGLGFIIQDAGTFFRIPAVFLGIFIIGLIGVTLEIVISLVERRMLHWQGK
jgi:NitT/TauT family transport system permease protein